MEEKYDIVDTAMKAGDFSTLVTALRAAGLVETLKGDGPFTVFAPTDSAFAEVPKETLNELLKPENREKLKAILTFHVVPGKIMAREVMDLSTAKTVQGQSLQIDKKNGVKINGAKVVAADIQTTNGVIHVIDQVLIPTNAAAA